MTDPVTRAFHRSDQLVGAGLRVLRGAFDGLWLGVLSLEQLGRVDASCYDALPEYVDEAYNRGGLTGWEQAAIERHFGGVRRIIVTSAGGGREVLALAKAGFEVTGFEPHPGLTDFGNGLLAADGTDATIRLSDRDGWPADSGDADGVVVGWGGYMHIRSRSRRVAFLRAAAGRLRPGAPILVSFFATGRHDVRLRTAARIGAPLRRLLGREPVRVGDALVPNPVHFFTRGEIADELAAGGFDMIDFGTTEYGWAVGRVRPQPGEDNG